MRMILLALDIIFRLFTPVLLIYKVVLLAIPCYLEKKLHHWLINTVY